ncbi:2Fe-2S iron-sulfur cluster-binding protein [Sulfuriferula nivalis]|uniref:Ferredoxin n=1 Tax=Sulfuriferula nivalis TaxID=2675298 RepID=A0A809RFQ3_9PROT|nr:2Fe-2S iron-sulfur cluster-binding protein [Sulfuriferula nivalis]BBO99703.1 ferredoxin [Sulfuriferula nivalis]
MGNVSFIGMKLPDRVRVDVHREAGRNLLDVAMEHSIPLPCDCMRGNCGACAVKVASLCGKTNMIRLSDKERYLLLTAGKISQMQYDAASLPDHPPLWRLACEYQVADEKIMVAF